MNIAGGFAVSFIICIFSVLTAHVKSEKSVFEKSKYGYYFTVVVLALLYIVFGIIL